MAEKKLRVDFHSHTLASRDSRNPINGVIEQARQVGLDRLVITDHNTIRGALKAKELAPELIIVGEEILTSKGELLAAFVTEEVPARLPPEEAIRRLRSQGAFISVSHPFDISRHGWRVKDLLQILLLVDAIEVFNARCLGRNLNRKAAQFAQDHGIAGTVGSDAHTMDEFGNAYLELPWFNDAESLRNIIAHGSVYGQQAGPWVRFGSTIAKLFGKKRKPDLKA